MSRGRGGRRVRPTAIRRNYAAPSYRFIGIQTPSTNHSIGFDGTCKKIKEPRTSDADVRRHVMHNVDNAFFFVFKRCLGYRMCTHGWICVGASAEDVAYRPAVHTYRDIVVLLVFPHQCDHIQDGVKRRGHVVIGPVHIMELC